MASPKSEPDDGRAKAMDFGNMGTCDTRPQSNLSSPLRLELASNLKVHMATAPVTLTLPQLVGGGA